jgi:NlpC/P60 family
MLLIAVMGLFQMGTSAASGFLSGRKTGIEIFPSTSPFVSMKVGFGMIGPVPPLRAIDRLMDAATRLSLRTNVPYVYGGHDMASGKPCQECTACVQKNHLSANSTLVRYQKCSACRRCGIDCSGFVNKLFSDAGLKYIFANTRTLNGAKNGYLQAQYGFNNIGRDLMAARPGDLLLEKSHIVMVLEVNHIRGTIDYIHASRGSTRTNAGGIEIRRGAAIDSLQLSIVRILRHVELISPSDLGDNLGASDSLWFNMKQQMPVSRWI